MPEWTVTTKVFCFSKQIQKKVFWRKSHLSLGINILVSWVGLCFVVYVLTHRFDPLWLIAIFVVATIENLLLYQMKIVRFLNNKQNQAILKPVSATINTEQLHWTLEPSTETTAPWSIVVNYFLIDDDVVLFLNKQTYWYLPRDCFESNDDYQTILGHVRVTVPIRRF